MDRLIAGRLTRRHAPGTTHAWPSGHRTGSALSPGRRRERLDARPDRRHRGRRRPRRPACSSPSRRSSCGRSRTSRGATGCAPCSRSTGRLRPRCSCSPCSGRPRRASGSASGHSSTSTARRVVPGRRVRGVPRRDRRDVAYHIPRNNALAAVDPDGAEAVSRWSAYAGAWTSWNHVRTLTSTAAAALLVIGSRASEYDSPPCRGCERPSASEGAVARGLRGRGTQWASAPATAVAPADHRLAPRLGGDGEVVRPRRSPPRSG